MVIKFAYFWVVLGILLRLTGSKIDIKVKGFMGFILAVLFQLLNIVCLIMVAIDLVNRILQYLGV